MKKGWSNEEENQLIDYYKLGMTIPKIAKLMNRSPKSVESKRWILKQLGRIEK